MPINFERNVLSESFEQVSFLNLVGAGCSDCFLGTRLGWGGVWGWAPGMGWGAWA